MPKLDYLQEKKLSPVDDLRSLLNSLEERLLTVKSMNSTQALILLRDLDQVYALFNKFEADGLNLLSERGRFETIQARFKKVVKSHLKALGGPAILSEYCPSPAPSREQWWWYMHEIVAEQQQRLLRQIVTAGVIILLIVGGLVLAFNTIWAPSPEVIARVDAENKAYEALNAGDYRLALMAIETGLAKVPDDPSLMLFKGVLHEILGEAEEADQSFAQVQASLNDPVAFYLGRGQLELRLSHPDKAERDAKVALAIDENLARAWLILGQSLELQDKKFEALQAYELAGQLGIESGDNEVVVLARLALGRISQAP